MNKSHRFLRSALIVILALVGLFAAAPTRQIVSAQSCPLLEDSFGSNENGWKLAGRIGEMDIDNDVLALTVDEENKTNWVTPNLKFPLDVTVSVDVQFLDTDDSTQANAGIVVRSDKRDTSTGFYQFEIDTAGNWAFVTRTAKGAEYKVADSGKLDGYDASDPHTLSVTSSGSDFIFNVDGEDVFTGSDDAINADLDEHYIGLLAGTFQGTDTITVEFSNLCIGEPDGSGGGGGSEGDVIFEDSFENNDAEWTLDSTKLSSSDIEDGALVIVAKTGAKEGVMRFVDPKGAFPFPTDVSVTVTVTPDESTAEGDWYYGVGLRYVEDGGDYSFYSFVVLSDGRWGFVEFTQDDANIIDGLNDLEWDPFDTNTITITAVGDTYTFYLNGEEVATVDDSSYSGSDESGVILLGSSMDEDSGVTLSFTDFVVTSAE
ncbi:MAG: hypothetical protein KF726_27160 [Anaerolineae bacterium]|nr:hypothetical protein [Anaerolineae bacterium]